MLRGVAQNLVYQALKLVDEFRQLLEAWFVVRIVLVHQLLIYQWVFQQINNNLDF